MTQACLALNVIARTFLNKTKEARASRIQNEFQAGGIVDCGCLKLSKDGIAVRRKRIDWVDVLKIEKFIVIVNVNRIKGSGHPVLQIYHRDNPKRARLFVDMCNVHDSDIVLPLIQGIVQSGSPAP